MRNVSWIVTLVVVSMVPGCGSFTPERETTRRFQKQHEAGSVHVSVLSVARWEDYVHALQPAFELTENEALKLVLPTTRALEESYVDAVRGGISGSAGKREASRKDVTTVTQDETPDGGTSTTESQKTEEDQSPNVSRNNSPLILNRSNPPGFLRSPELEVKPDSDPLLQFWSATALYQEVQLLNRYIKDAAVRDGFTPYVVRMQVSLMPTARHEPYDAYCTVSFFSQSDPLEESEAGSESAREARGPSTTLLRGLDWQPEAIEKRTPQVVPLMVTDNLEATLHSRTEDKIRQMAGSLLFLSGSVGASADLDSVMSQFQRVFGKDLNSLLTVGRVTDNTIRVRLGAAQEAAGSYAMVPRTHNISVLLMIPEGVTPTVDLVARTVMVDALTGTALEDRKESEVQIRIQEVLSKYAITGVSEEKIRELVGLTQKNDQYGFAKMIRQELGADFTYEKSLWVDLVLLMVGSQYGSTQFDLPSRPDVDSPRDYFPRQTVFLSDDGHSRTQGTLRSVRAVSADDISATLYIPYQGRDIPLLAEEVEMDVATGDVLLVFPSLFGWGLEAGERTTPLRIQLTIEGGSASCDALYQLRPVDPQDGSEKE